jgi:peptidoglycan/LPS O-acetylase OafA/YrhL
MNEFFKEINSLRAFACLGVILSHNFLPLPYNEFGAASVILFFVISGFIISHSLQSYIINESGKINFLDFLDNFQTISSTNAHNIRVFLLRRAYRIFPCLIFLFFLALIFLPLMAKVFGFSLSNGLIGYMRQIANIFFGTLTFYLHQFPILTAFQKFESHFQLSVCWTLVVEFFFYLLFPLFLLFVKRKRTQAIFLILGGHIIRLICLYISPQLGYFLIFSNIDAFFTGVFIYFLTSKRNKTNISNKVLIFFSFLSIFVLIFYPFQYPSIYFSHVFTNYIIASGALVYVAALNTGILMPKLLAPLLSYFGNRSYVMYLYHLLFSFVFSQISFLENLKISFYTNIFYYIIKLFVFMLVVEILYHFIERYFIKIAKEKFVYKKFEWIPPQEKIVANF